MLSILNFFLFFNLVILTTCDVSKIYFAIPKVSHPTPPYCKNCKYMMVENTRNRINHIQYGKCLLYPIRKNENYYLVTGIEKVTQSNDIQEIIDITIDYEYCVAVRKNENKCGMKGIYFENKFEDNDIDLNFF